ncbi:MAG TPA: hypothetical protein VNW92_01435 [Polyangiaceae bacterium]|nr:hypothetical protein [Polyangiaceae bacterium]
MRVKLRRTFRYLKRHWDGRLSPGKSFWLRGAGLNVLLMIFIHLLQRWLVDRTLREIRVVSVLALCVLGCISMWQWVGIWRAVGRRRIGPVARWLARGCAAFALFALWTGSRAVAANHDASLEHGAFVCRMLGKTQAEAEFSGVIADGASRALEALLRQHPTVRVLHLNSPGGLINEGLRLAKLVHSHGLEVVVDNSCQSACTHALLAGARRWARPNAQIGFHQARLLGGVTDEASFGDGVLATTLSQVGASEEFVGAALRTPDSEVYSPSIEELLTQHVLTGSAKDDQFIYSSPLDDRSGIENWLALGDPLLAAMREVDPPTFARVVDEYEHAGENGATLAAVTKAAARAGATEWHTLNCNGSPDAARVRLTSLQHLVAATAERFPERCKSWLLGDVELSGLPSALLDERNQAMAASLRASRLYPPVRDHQIDSDRAFAALTKILSEPTRTTIRAVAGGKSSDDRAACSAAAEYFHKLAILPPAQMSVLLRGDTCIDAEATRR